MPDQEGRLELPATFYYLLLPAAVLLQHVRWAGRVLQGHHRGNGDGGEGGRRRWKEELRWKEEEMEEMEERGGEFDTSD